MLKRLDEQKHRHSERTREESIGPRGCANSWILREYAQDDNPHRPAISSRRRPRRGSVYIAIVSISMLVAIIGVGSLLAVRSQYRASEASNDSLEARTYAASGIEIGKQLMYSDSSWRTNHSNGTWISNQAIGSGTFSLDVVNPNGALNHSDSDPVTVTSTGVKGSARQKIQVTLTPVLKPLTCLNYAIAVNGVTTISNNITYTKAALGCNSSITAAGSVNVPTEAVTSISGSTYYSPQKTGITPITMPDTSTVFTYYTTNGTYITTLPLSGGVLQLQMAVLSPGSNPYGSTNANGIYVIDCQNKQIQIGRVRLVGTLVLLNVGAGSAVSGAINMAPYVSNYPTLMVQGGLTLSFAAGNLSENSTDKVSYNPVSTPYPYPSGTGDTDYVDVFPSTITGLVYVSGDVQTSGGPSVSNLVVGGQFTGSSGSLTPSYLSTYYGNPPPGFFPTPSMTPQTGTWKRSG